MRCSTEPRKVREKQLPASTSNYVPSPQRHISRTMCPEFVPRPELPDYCFRCRFHRLYHSKESREQLLLQVPERTIFTREQVNEMRNFADQELHWSTRTRDQPELIDKVDRFCRRIKVDVAKFKSWVLNNKKKYRGSSSSAPPPLQQLVPEEHKQSSSSAAPLALPAPLHPKLEEHHQSSLSAPLLRPKLEEQEP